MVSSLHIEYGCYTYVVSGAVLTIASSDRQSLKSTFCCQPNNIKLELEEERCMGEFWCARETRWNSVLIDSYSG